MNDDFFSKQPDKFGTVLKRLTKGTFGLISNKKDNSFFTPKIVFQMVADSVCFAHTAGGKNHLWRLIDIN